MSNELYPSNSTIIDLRSKISSSIPSKTKQFIGELNRLTATPAPKDHSNPNRTFESERWFTPRPNEDDLNATLPPRRSMFTPSRLQNLSLQRTREARKPYWRCPMPKTKPSVDKSNPLSNIERVMEAYSSTTTSSNIAKEPTISVTPAPMKSFVRRREPDAGKKTNIFNVDDDELAVEQDDNSITEIQTILAKIPPPVLFNAPKAGFLTDETPIEASNEYVFTFADPSIRRPRSPTPPQTKPVMVEKEMQTEPIKIQQPENKHPETSAANAPFPISNGTASLPIPPVPTTTTSTGGGFTFGVLPVNGGATTGITLPTEPTTVASKPNLFSTAPESIFPVKNDVATKNSELLFGAPPAAQLPAGGFQFGAPQTNGTVPSFQFGATTNSIGGADNGLSGRSISGNSEFTFGASTTAVSGGGFNFGALPVNGSGTFQFSGSTTTDVTDGGLSSRSGIPARKLLQARRMKKR